MAMDASGLLRQANHAVQDAHVAWQGREQRHSAVIIVAIDEKTASALGDLPLPRATHAALIDRITQDAPLAIGLDLPLTASQTRSAADDEVLAAALQKSGKVVLPMTMQSAHGHSPWPLQPARTLATSASRLGLNHLPADSDGVLRSVYLQEGPRDLAFDHLGLAMLRVGEPARFSMHVPGSPGSEALPHAPPSGPGIGWWRSHRLIVPFSGPSGHFPRVSYIDVLNGSIPPGTFHGKYVLVGATATQFGRMHRVPVMGSDPWMSDVEINANVLDGLLGGHEVTPAPRWLSRSLNASAVVLALVGMAFLAPLPALLLAGALALALLSASWAGFALLRLQFAPMAGVLGLGTAYTLWSWSRLNAATRYLIEACAQLHTSTGPAQRAPGEVRSTGDFLGRRIKALTHAARHLRDLHRLVSDSFDSLPDAKLVCDRQGRVRLANAAAARYFHADSSDALRNRSAVALMGGVRSSDDDNAVVTSELLAQRPTTEAMPARDDADRDLLVKRAPSLDADGQHVGWIFSLIDVTEMRQAQRQNDQTIHFLSHDICAPQAAILTLLELDENDPDAMTRAQLRKRIERHAQKALALSEGFIQLARARSQPYRVALCDLGGILLECIDDTWEARQHAQVRMVLDPGGVSQAFCHIDRELVSRAIDNLLGNAIKHSPAHSTITCAVEPHRNGWAVRIQDQGPGIRRDRQAAIFQPFERGEGGHGRAPGAGLGLAFVKTVATRHGGQVLLHSGDEGGCTFWLVLPKRVAVEA